MALNNFNEFNDMHKSFLQEIGNMGTANAATEISKMFSSTTDISTPQVRINPAVIAGKVADMLCANAETFHITLCGDIKGSLLFIFPYATIERIVSAFFPDTSVKGKDDMNEMTVSIVQETVNISAASYANCMALMSGLMVDISVPNTVAVPSKELVEISNACGDVACFVKTAIEFTDDHSSFDVIFYPEVSTMASFMGKMGL